jgi:hypothetical protein
LGQTSKLGSIWNPPRTCVTEPGSGTSRRTGTTLRATVLGLALGVLALVATAAAALLIASILFETSIGSLR